MMDEKKEQLEKVRRAFPGIHTYGDGFRTIF